jgi:hypothetical protein
MVADLEHFPDSRDTSMKKFLFVSYAHVFALVLSAPCGDVQWTGTNVTISSERVGVLWRKV